MQGNRCHYVKRGRPDARNVCVKHQNAFERESVLRFSLPVVNMNLLLLGSKQDMCWPMALCCCKLSNTIWGKNSLLAEGLPYENIF